MLAVKTGHGMTMGVHARGCRRDEAIVGEEIDTGGAEADIGIAGSDGADADTGTHIVSAAARDPCSQRQMPACRPLGAQRPRDLCTVDKSWQYASVDTAGCKKGVVPLAGGSV